jgi:hypothetical protein
MVSPRGLQTNQRYIVVATILACLISGGTLGCQQPGEETTAHEVTFEQLFSSPEQFHGKDIILEGFYFHGFEVIVLAEGLEYSGYAEGHLVPRGRMLWVEGGIPLEIYNQLYQQQMMGPDERYGKIKVKGKFEYGGQYGHVGGYNYQITPSQVELLSWPPPEK